MRNYYVVLGVESTANHEEIQIAYRRLVKKHHPDVSGTDSAAVFLEIQEAWDTLGDRERRRQYDATLRRRRVRSSSTLVRDTTPGRHSFRRTAPTEGSRTLHLELRLTAAEAARGGDVPVDVPALRPCARCGGRSGFMYPCPNCRGKGHIAFTQTMTLHVSPGLSDGELLHVTLPGFNALYRRLAIHVVVDRL